MANRQLKDYQAGMEVYFDTVHPKNDNIALTNRHGRVTSSSEGSVTVEDIGSPVQEKFVINNPSKIRPRQ